MLALVCVCGCGMWLEARNRLKRTWSNLFAEKVVDTAQLGYLQRCKLVEEYLRNAT